MITGLLDFSVPGVVPAAGQPTVADNLSAAFKAYGVEIERVGYFKPALTLK
ncbi:hypothetical protein [Pontibacter mucosus]|uniref:hypothetical protein n=1 Tax=Pontibacter mucosus TaxID=1649266 RepID=UPI001B8691F5|nr:hypothetical protein [Pontibacter mucosus]